MVSSPVHGKGLLLEEGEANGCRDDWNKATTRFVNGPVNLSRMAGAVSLQSLAVNLASLAMPWPPAVLRVEPFGEPA